MDEHSRSPTLDAAVFGTTIVRRDGAVVKMTPRERLVVAALATTHPRPMRVDTVIETLWPDRSPASDRQIVQNNVSSLRRRLGSASLITDTGPTYGLGGAWSLDVDRFARHLDYARGAAMADDHRAEVGHLRRALDIARGQPFADLPQSEAVEAKRRHHAQLLLAAQEDAVLAELAAGHVVAAVAAASQLVVAEPYRELRWSLQALGQCRTGDRRGALESLRQGRQALGDIGLDPGPVLVRLELLILDDDHRLTDAPPRVALGLDSPVQLMVDRTMSRAGGVPDPDDGLERLRAMCNSAADSHTALWVTVTGATTLSTRFFSQQITFDATLDGWTVLSAGCHPQARRILEPLGALVRQAIDRTPGLINTDGHGALSVLWDDSVPHAVAGTVPGDAAVAVLERCAVRAPTLVIIEEAQHLSTSALELLAELVSRPIPLVVIAVGAAPPAVVPEGAQVVRLADPAPGGEYTSDTQTKRPSGIEPARRRDLGRVAAVIAVAGSPLSTEAIASTQVVVDGLDSLLLDGVDVGLLTHAHDGGFDLADTSTRASLAEGLDPAAREAIHRRLAASYLSQGHSFAAAPHLLRSDTDPRLIIDHVRDAASQASQIAMFAESAALLGDAVEFAGRHLGADDESTLELMLDRADNLRRVGDRRYLDVVWEVVERADRAALYRVYALAAAALCKLGPLTDAGTIDPNVADVVARALQRCDDPAARARCAGEATLFFSMGGAADLCRGYFEEALGLARTSGDVDLMIGALGNAYLVLTHPSEVERRGALADEMLALAERIDSDDARCEALHFAFAVQVQRCDPMLRTAFIRQHELAQRLGPGRIWMAGYQQSCLALLDGRFDEAIGIASRSFDNAPVSSSRATTALTMSTVAVRLAQGRGDELCEQIDQAIAEFENMPAWRLIAAFLAAQRGDLTRARDECERVAYGDSLPLDLAWGGAVLLLGRTVARLGDRLRGVQVRDMIAPFAGTMSWVSSATVGPFDLALAELSLELGEFDRARASALSLERCIDRLGAEAYRPDLERVRRGVEQGTAGRT